MLMLAYDNSDKPDPVDNLGTIFTARRDLLTPIRERVITERSGLTLEEADVLVLLYEATELEGPELTCDQEGYVAFHELQAALVHSAALLSQRLRKLQDKDLVDVIPLRHRKKVPLSVRQARHGNSACVRITAKGRRKILPVWERYKKLAEELLSDLPPEVRRAHLRLNQHISQKLRFPKAEPLPSANEIPGIGNKNTPPSDYPASAATPSVKQDHVVQDIVRAALWKFPIRPLFDRRIREKLNLLNLPVLSIKHPFHPVVVLKIAVPVPGRLHPELLECRVRMAFRQAGFPVPENGILKIIPDRSWVRVYARPRWFDGPPVAVGSPPATGGTEDRGGSRCLAPRLGQCQA